MARINDAVTSSEWPMGNGSPISMHTSIQEFDLPAPRMDNVRDICSAMEGCESSAAAENFFCDERGQAYIDKLLVLFQEAEDLEADDVLGHICLIFCKLINMSCEPIVGHLVSSEKFNIVVRRVYITFHKRITGRKMRRSGKKYGACRPSEVPLGRGQTC